MTKGCRWMDGLMDGWMDGWIPIELMSGFCLGKLIPLERLGLGDRSEGR